MFSVLWMIFRDIFLSLKRVVLSDERILRPGMSVKRIFLTFRSNGISNVFVPRNRKRRKCFDDIDSIRHCRLGPITERVKRLVLSVFHTNFRLVATFIYEVCSI